VTDRIAAEIGVRRLHALCADAVWRRDPQAFARCYTKDGEWKIVGQLVKGHEAIGKTLTQLGAGNTHVLMTFGSPILDFSGGQVSGRTYVTERAKLLDGSSAMSVGIYYERYVEVGGEWLFSWRHFDFCYWGPLDLSGDFYPVQDYGPSPAFPDDDQPTAGLRL